MPALAEDAFRYEFPPGKQVYDFRDKTLYIVTQNGEMMNAALFFAERERKRTQKKLLDEVLKSNSVDGDATGIAAPTGSDQGNSIADSQPEQTRSFPLAFISGALLIAGIIAVLTIGRSLIRRQEKR